MCMLSYIDEIHWWLHFLSQNVSLVIGFVTLFFGWHLVNFCYWTYCSVDCDWFDRLKLVVLIPHYSRDFREALSSTLCILSKHGQCELVIIAFGTREYGLLKPSNDRQRKLRRDAQKRKSRLGRQKIDCNMQFARLESAFKLCLIWLRLDYFLTYLCIAETRRGKKADGMLQNTRIANTHTHTNTYIQPTVYFSSN